jgi:ABC-type spermidine/putrescine transport system permease subunit I
MIIGISIICLLLSFVVAYFGRNRSMTFWGYFFASLILTPLVGALLVIVSKEREEKNT